MIRGGHDTSREENAQCACEGEEGSGFELTSCTAVQWKAVAAVQACNG